MSDEATWYKDAVIYELHVRAFSDSDGDGVGDFRGLVSKLDYIADLGVTAIWLLPFYPSPGRDDGYDIADYHAVNSDYGTLKDVRRLVREAHARGLRVITELVCNHTSDQHAWFQRARRARPGSWQRDFYVWSDTPDRYRDARIIFKDFERSNWAYDDDADAYYWHRFYSHQPDLNYDNPRVEKEILRVVDFWLGMGIDGLRLDAIPYLYEREGTNCENLPESHAFLKRLRAHVDANFPGRMLLAEANQWPEDAVTYFGDGLGDECHMAFHFPLMPRLFMSVQMEDRFPIIDILAQTPAIPELGQWAMFLRNHDELTLEMVTDEERDYMWRVYSSDRAARINLGIRRRLAPLMNNNRRRIELMNALLFSMPGTPVVYYGDEIGMGDNIYLGDRNGVRTPMQWSADRNAGFSESNRQRLYLPVIVDPEYHYESVNVEAQAANPQSLLHWMRRLIALRRAHPAFGRGTLEFLHPENRKVLAFIRRDAGETILVVANLSRFPQWAQFDLSSFEGMIPHEMFGRTPFPAIGKAPYQVTLGPHGFYWFTVDPAPVIVEADERLEPPVLSAHDGLAGLVRGGGAPELRRLLPGHVRRQRWFASKARRITGIRVADAVPVGHGLGPSMVAMLEVTYSEGDPERYLLPLAIARGELAEQVWERAPWAVVARLDGAGESVLIDSLADPGFASALLEAISRRRRYRGIAGDILALPSRALRRMRDESSGELAPSLSMAEQSNNSVVFGERLILKVYRRLAEGINPDLEVGRFLTERTGFGHIAPVAGSILYRTGVDQVAVLGTLQAYVPHEGDAWHYVQRLLAGYLDAPAISDPGAGFTAAARLLGTRTGELHTALASDSADPAFAPEPTTMLDARSIYQSIRSLHGQVMDLLRRSRPGLGDPLAASAADRLLASGDVLLRRCRPVVERPVSAQRIRVHGDYHLGQVLWSGSDYTIIDFEGEPARPLNERRLKRWATKDVAGMLRSFDYAAAAALRERERGPEAEPLLAAWVNNVRAAFLEGYLAATEGAPFRPADPAEWGMLLDVMLVEKALYELRYELNSRPAWAAIPLRGLLLLAGPGSRES